MIFNSGMKPEAFLQGIANTIGGGDASTPRFIVDDDAEIYLASGYWRALPVWKDGRLHGVRLANPDRTAEEIGQVERGVAILRHYVWK